MKSFTNIEKSKFKPGCYIGYASGKIYLIKKNGKEWLARNRDDASDFMRSRTLAGMSHCLTLRAAGG